MLTGTDYFRKIGGLWRSPVSADHPDMPPSPSAGQIRRRGPVLARSNSARLGGFGVTMCLDPAFHHAPCDMRAPPPASRAGTSRPGFLCEGPPWKVW